MTVSLFILPTGANTPTPPLHAAPEVRTNEELHSPSPEPLYNPYLDGAAPSYIRRKTANGVVYQHATAGAIVKKAVQEKTLWQKLRDKNQLKYNGCQWGRWGSKIEWDDAYWMVTSKASQSSLEQLLKTERVSISFNSME